MLSGLKKAYCRNHGFSNWRLARIYGLCDPSGMGSNFETSLAELAEHERAAEELTRLRRKGIPCHLENRPQGNQSHVDVVRDDREVQEDLGHLEGLESRGR